MKAKVEMTDNTSSILSNAKISRNGMKKPTLKRLALMDGKLYDSNKHPVLYQGNHESGTFEIDF